MHPESPSAPVHVLSLVASLGSTGGGAERMARELAARLNSDRYRRTLCVTRASTKDKTPEELSIARSLEGRGVHVMLLDRRHKLDLRAWRPLVDYIRREKVDVLHSHMFGSNVSAAVLGPMARVPVVIAHEHGWSYSGQPWRRVLDRELISRSCDAMIASSQLTCRKMVEVERIDPERTRLIYVRNGIVAPIPTGRSVRAELGIAADAPVVGAVARLDQYKALHILIDAAPRLKATFPSVRILIVGEGSERSRLEARIARQRLGDVISLLGSRTDVPDLIEAFDVATLCSYSETTPLAIMEYMALGKPVVATRVGGIPDLITHRVHGLLVDAYDPEALATAIGGVLSSPDHGAAMGARGLERQRREFSIDAVARRVEGIYEELLNARANRLR